MPAACVESFESDLGTAMALEVPSCSVASTRIWGRTSAIVGEWRVSSEEAQAAYPAASLVPPGSVEVSRSIARVSKASVGEK